MKFSAKGWEHVKILICVFLLFGLTISIFNYTDEIRAPWFGVLSGSDQWSTGSTITFATNWYEEGPLNLKFAMLENPPSIEFPTIQSRSPYTSYPPGAVIPIYLISVLENHKPTVAMVMRYDLLNQFLVAFFLGLTIFLFFRQMKMDMINSLLFSTIPIILMSLLPGPLYWFQNVYFSDQAVILPFVVYIFLELLRDGMVGRNLRILNIIQNLVLFYGFLTDWLFVFIALTVYFKRVIDGEIVYTKKISLNSLYIFLKDSLKYWIVPIVAVGLYIIQVIVLGNTTKTFSRFLYQSSISQNGTIQLNNGLNKFLNYIFIYYGKIGLYLLIISGIIYIAVIIYVLFNKYRKKNIGYDLIKVKKTLYLISMLFIPCVIQVIMFKTHSLENIFSVLKFSLIISTVPLVLLPLLLFIMLENYQFGSFKNKFNSFKTVLMRYKINPRLFLIFLLAFSMTLAYVVVDHPNPSKLFPDPYSDYEIIGYSVAKNTGYYDVAFSPDFLIRANPPQQLSFSGKIVHQVNSTEDMKNVLNGINGNYQIVIIFLYPPSDYWKKILNNSTLVTDGTIRYYRINASNIQ